jgi:hypothetical protein
MAGDFVGLECTDHPPVFIARPSLRLLALRLTISRRTACIKKTRERVFEGVQGAVRVLACTRYRQEMLDGDATRVATQMVDKCLLIERPVRHFPSHTMCWTGRPSRRIHDAIAFFRTSSDPHAVLAAGFHAAGELFFECPSNSPVIRANAERPVARPYESVVLSKRRVNALPRETMSGHSSAVDAELTITTRMLHANPDVMPFAFMNVRKEPLLDISERSTGEKALPDRKVPDCPDAPMVSPRRRNLDSVKRFSDFRGLFAGAK